MTRSELYEFGFEVSIKQIKEPSPRNLYEVSIFKHGHRLSLVCTAEGLFDNQESLLDILTVKFHKTIEKIDGFGQGDASMTFL